MLQLLWRRNRETRRRKREKEQKNMKEEEFENSIITLIAQENYDKMISELEARKRNITIEFIKHTTTELKNDQKLNWNCNAQVRKGKSTLLIKLVMMILEIMRELKQTTETIGIHNIMRDEHELSEEYKKKNIYRTVRMVDEHREIDETGLNATTEKALISTLSDQNAGQYIHTIRARPIGITDKNCDINIVVTGTNRKTKKTKALIYYKLQTSNEYIWVLCGHIIVDVKELIKRWEEIKGEFERERKGTATKEDIEKIKKTRKEDFYTEYQIRKYKAIDLIRRTGYLRIRDLEEEAVIYKTYKRLKGLIKDSGRRTTRDQVKSELILIEREERKVFSVLGRTETTDRIYTILGQYYQCERYLKDWIKAEKELEEKIIEIYGVTIRNKEELTRFKEREELDEELEELRETAKGKERAKDAMFLKLDEHLRALEKAEETLKEYNEILSGEREWAKHTQ